jgi:hypothetical protein
MEFRPWERNLVQVLAWWHGYTVNAVAAIKCTMFILSEQTSWKSGIWIH